MMPDRLQHFQWDAQVNTCSRDTSACCIREEIAFQITAHACSVVDSVVMSSAGASMCNVVP